MIHFKIEQKLKRIKKYATTRFDDLQMWGLFSTEPGMRFKRQLQEVSRFVFACCLLSLPFRELQDEWFKTIRSGEFKSLRPIAESKDEFDKITSQMETIVDLMDSSEDSDFNHIIGTREIHRFLGLYTISTFAYLDTYADAVIELLIDEGKETPVLVYLARNDVYNNRNKTKVVTLKHVRNLGINQRLQVLEESLGVRRRSFAVFNEEEYNRCRRLLRYFVQLRGNIVHSDPAPSLSKFDHKFFTIHRKSVREALLSVFNEMTNMPDPLRNQTEIIEKWLNKLLPTFTIIFSIPKMIVVFIALLDAATADHLS